MWVIWTNSSITRRKSYFLVTCPEGVTRFRHRHFWPCVQWLDAEGVTRYHVLPSEIDQPDVSPLVIETERS